MIMMIKMMTVIRNDDNVSNGNDEDYSDSGDFVIAVFVADVVVIVVAIIRSAAIMRVLNN